MNLDKKIEHFASKFSRAALSFCLHISKHNTVDSFTPKVIFLGTLLKTRNHPDRKKLTYTFFRFISKFKLKLTRTGNNNTVIS